MADSNIHTVTGAFGYTGKYIAQRLLDAGRRVQTLTNSPHREHAFGDRVTAQPLCFDNPDKLAESLRGTRVLYNTYWVRFNHRLFKHAAAVQNTRTLFDAAKRAGVERIVHVSVSNPSEDSPFEYFRGKAQLEKALIESGLSYAILRPAVLFGGEDILINNIAWLLRKVPIFCVFGDGEYRLQPIHVDDFADLAVQQGEQTANVIIEAIGPETFTYRDLVRQIGTIIGKPRRIVCAPPGLVYWIGRVVSCLVGDVTITRQEIGALMADLLWVESAAPIGPTKLTDWARQNADQLGRRYANELKRRIDRKTGYARL